MRMKKRFLGFVVLAGLMTACINNDDSLYKETNAQEIIQKFIMTEKFEVPVQEGSYTVVTMGEDTLYYGNVAVSIDVPQFDATTRAVSDLKWHYTLTKPAGSSDWWYSVARYGVLAFEDLLNGDNDYNDFVCGIIEVINFDRIGDTWTASASNVRVKPLALGNTIPLKFGVEYRKKSNKALVKDLVFATDVRKGLFANGAGFINTDPNGTIIPLAQLAEKDMNGTEIGRGLATNDLCSLWYIEVDGLKRYVADANANLLQQDVLDDMIMANKVPFGLYIPGAGVSLSSWRTTYKWPAERENIFSTFPNFQKWLDGQVNNPFGNPNTSALFNTSLMGL